MSIKRTLVLRRVLAPAISILGFLVLWHLMVSSTRVGILMPSPVSVLKRFFTSFYEPVGSQTMAVHMLRSLGRVVPAYFLGASIGIFLGITMGWYKSIEYLLRPLFEIVRPIPPLAWIPLAILWFGVDEGSKIFIIFLAAFVSCTINAYSGAKAVDPVIVGCARMLGANDRQVFSQVVLPSAVPYIFAGLQIALSSSWATVVAAEMIRSTEGVGWIIISSLTVNDSVQTIVGIVAIGIVGYILAVIMRKVEAKLVAWNERET